MASKSRGSLATDPGEKLKEKKIFFMNRDPIVKCQKFRGQNENGYFS